MDKWGNNMMDKRSKTMLIVTIFLFVALVIKSTWIDPARPKNADEGHYMSFAQEIAPEVHDSILYKTRLLTYRITDVEKQSREGSTRVKYKDLNNNIVEKTLEGRYAANARVYMLYVLPYKDFLIEGGL
jgi:hypothetical protein